MAQFDLFRGYKFTPTEKRSAAEKIAADRGIKLKSAQKVVQRAVKAGKDATKNPPNELIELLSEVVKQGRNQENDSSPEIKSGFIWYWSTEHADGPGFAVVMFEYNSDSEIEAIDIAEGYVPGGMDYDRFTEKQAKNDKHLEIFIVSVRYTPAYIDRVVQQKKNKYHATIYREVQEPAGYLTEVTVWIPYEEKQ